MSDNGISPHTSSYASATSTRFDQDFSRLAGPGLLNLVIGYAYLVQTGVSGFSEAANAVLREALRLGAAHLSGPVFNDLIDWIDLELLRRIDDPPQFGVLSPRQVEALIREEA